MTRVEVLHQELLARQNGKTDKAFAALWPRMSRQYWQKLRIGDRPITLAVCGQIIVAFPKPDPLTPLAIEALQEIAEIGCKERMAKR